MLSRLAARSAAVAAQHHHGARLCVAAPVRLFHCSEQHGRPIEPIPEEGGKVRMGVFPEEWFQFFYKKTGVTGPYVFGTGLLATLLSKEYLIINNEFIAGGIFVSFVVYIIRKFGPNVATYADKLRQERIDYIDNKKGRFIGACEEGIETEKKEQWRAEGVDYLFDAKKANVAMQLETAYRERLHEVSNAVKRRLDYQLDVENTQRRMAQEHMADWVVSNVVKSITPQQEKEAIAKCIEDLKRMAKAS
ncbi:PREDICTED: ATP synthase F(0) complex subunit B1, mitochondrial-like [Branchiostoma belcheri]|uniref:ATP synthase subunit b n=1 Tax=Branchiostoma belcheri TaxID=7741 RepID=A0A6P4ZN14_BRABE|nr:PREDICTED: ATP synthase F(0) complex subunit B1, mitochondrial-like [Branchiostoma belcheri]